VCPLGVVFSSFVLVFFFFFFFFFYVFPFSEQDVATQMVSFLSPSLPSLAGGDLSFFNFPFSSFDFLFFHFFFIFQKMDFSKPFEASDLLARLLAGNEFPENPASSQGNGLLKPSDETIRPICELAKAYFTKENNVLDISAGGDNPIIVRQEAPGCCHTYHTSLLYTILSYSILFSAVAQMVVLFFSFSDSVPRFVEISMASSMICWKCSRQWNSPKEDHSRSEGDTSSWVSFFLNL